MTQRDTLPELPSTGERRASSVRREDKGPPCRRCGGRSWEVEPRRKAVYRWLLELVFAAPDVWIFQGESGGWPSKRYERWTCLDCGRKVRVPR